MNLKLNLNYFRKVFAKCMPNKGIEPELVDLLQPTISNLVFVNHLDQILTNLL